MLNARTTLEGQPSSVPAARRWAVATLQAWRMPETAWTAAQVVSELATNCTLHARTGFTVTLTVDDGCLRIEAEDDSPVALQARQYSETATTGRGLRMVALMATDWGVTPRDPGKAVWALLEVEEADVAGRSVEGRAATRPRAAGRGAASGSGPAAPVARAAA